MTWIPKDCDPAYGGDPMPRSECKQILDNRGRRKRGIQCLALRTAILSTDLMPFIKGFDIIVEEDSIPRLECKQILDNCKELHDKRLNTFQYKIYS